MGHAHTYQDALSFHHSRALLEQCRESWLRDGGDRVAVIADGHLEGFLTPREALRQEDDLPPGTWCFRILPEAEERLRRARNHQPFWDIACSLIGQPDPASRFERYRTLIERGHSRPAVLSAVTLAVFGLLWQVVLRWDDRDLGAGDVVNGWIWHAVLLAAGVLMIANLPVLQMPGILLSLAQGAAFALLPPAVFAAASVLDPAIRPIPAGTGPGEPLASPPSLG